eukprot:5821244-Pleurochrysis_carterae.AAC.1
MGRARPPWRSRKRVREQRPVSIEKGLRHAGTQRPAARVRMRRKRVSSWRHVRAELGGSERSGKIVWRASEHGQGHPQSSTT